MIGLLNWNVSEILDCWYDWRVWSRCVCMFCVCERRRLTCTFFSYFLVGHNIKSPLRSEWWAPLLFILHSGVFTRKILRWGPRWNVVDQTAVPWDVSEPSHTRVGSVNETFVDFCWLGVSNTCSMVRRLDDVMGLFISHSWLRQKPWNRAAPICVSITSLTVLSWAELSRAEPEVDALWSGAKARCVAIGSTPRDRETECVQLWVFL